MTTLIFAAIISDLDNFSGLTGSLLPWGFLAPSVFHVAGRMTFFKCKSNHGALLRKRPPQLCVTPLAGYT